MPRTRIRVLCDGNENPTRSLYQSTHESVQDFRMKAVECVRSHLRVLTLGDDTRYIADGVHRCGRFRSEMLESFSLNPLFGGAISELISAYNLRNAVWPPRLVSLNNSGPVVLNQAGFQAWLGCEESIFNQSFSRI